MLTQALEGRKTALGPNHISTLHTVNTLSFLYEQWLPIGYPLHVSHSLKPVGGIITSYRTSLCLQVRHSFFVAWPQQIVGFGSVSLTSAPQTVLLDWRSPSAEQGPSATQQFSLRSLVEQIAIPVRLNPFLFNGHVQTISVAIGWAGLDYHIHYKRKRWLSDSEIYPGQFTMGRLYQRGHRAAACHCPSRLPGRFS